MTINDPKDVFTIDEVIIATADFLKENGFLPATFAFTCVVSEEVTYEQWDEFLVELDNTIADNTITTSWNTVSNGEGGEDIICYITFERGSDV